MARGGAWAGEHAALAQEKAAAQRGKRRGVWTSEGRQRKSAGEQAGGRRKPAMEEAGDREDEMS